MPAGAAGPAALRPLGSGGPSARAGADAAALSRLQGSGGPPRCLPSLTHACVTALRFQWQGSLCRGRAGSVPRHRHFLRLFHGNRVGIGAGVTRAFEPKFGPAHHPVRVLGNAWPPQRLHTLSMCGGVTLACNLAR